MTCRIGCLMSLVCPFLLGCGLAVHVTGSGASDVTGVPGKAILGGVHGGQQPITGAKVVLYGSTDGATAVSLMTGPVTTGTDGTFNLTGKYQCPATGTTYVYIVSVGGNPGMAAGTNNANAVLMAGLGTCGQLSASTYINVNELTTVGSVAALSRYMAGGYAALATSAASVPQLAAAMSLVSEYTNTATGTVPGPTLPSLYSAPSLKVASLANAIAACINTNGGVAGDSTPCGKLFSYGTIPSNTPTDTVRALVNIMRYPESNVGSIYSLATPNQIFNPALTVAPADWSFAIVPPGGGTVSFSSTTQTTYLEGALYAVLEVDLSAANPDNSVSVLYRMADGTAQTTRDYTSKSGTLTWAAGANAPQFIVVPLLNPGTSSGSRTFTVSLAQPVGGISLGSNPQIAVTITGNSLDSQVAALPTTTTAEAMKKAALQWWLNAAYSTESPSTSVSLLSDVTTGLAAPASAFALPTSLPSTLFPTVPLIGTTTANPSVTAANANIAMYLNSTDTRTSFSYNNVYDYVSLSAGDQPTGYGLRTAEDMLSALTMFNGSDATYYGNALLVPAVLTQMENAAAYITATPSNLADFTNDSEFAVLYMMLTQGYPAIVPPTLQAAWKQTVAVNTAAIVQQYGGHFVANTTDISNNPVSCLLPVPGTTGIPGDFANNWVNNDVRQFPALVYGNMIAGTPLSSASPYVIGALNEMCYSLLPDGGTNYHDQQNEGYSYHPVFVREISRYGMITGDAKGAALATGTRYYTDLSLLGSSVGEYVTAPSWKKYWYADASGNEGLEIVAGLANDGVAQAQLNAAVGVGYPASYYDAHFYQALSALPATPLPTNWISYDGNAEGPRGAESSFYFMSTTRPTPVSTRGKSTYVGAVMLDSTGYNASFPGYLLNSAVESAGTVVTKVYGAEVVAAGQDGPSSPNVYDEAQNEFNASSATSTFGAVSTVHSLAGYGTTASSWTEDEAWVLLPTRVIGLVSVSNSAAESANQLDGGFRVVCGNGSGGVQKTWSVPGANQWQYGSMAIQVYDNDYASSRYELSNTWGDSANMAGWLLLTDAHDSTTTPYTFPAGTSHYFVADFRPATNASAGSVQRLTGLASGLQGFSFVDTDGVSYTMVQNTTSGAIAYTAPTGSTVTVGSTAPTAANQYRAAWINNGTAGVPAAVTYTGSIPAYSHIVAVH